MTVVPSGTVFVDTAALFALLDADAAEHATVRAAFDRLLDDRTSLVTSNYVVLETTALLQRRIGVAPVRALHERLLPVMEVVWVDRPLHELAYRAHGLVDRRRISLVDWTSFEVMRRHGIDSALTLDVDFEAQGFAVLP